MRRWGFKRRRDWRYRFGSLLILAVAVRHGQPQQQLFARDSIVSCNSLGTEPLRNAGFGEQFGPIKTRPDLWHSVE